MSDNKQKGTRGDQRDVVMMTNVVLSNYHVDNFGDEDVEMVWEDLLVEDSISDDDVPLAYALKAHTYSEQSDLEEVSDISDDDPDFNPGRCDIKLCKNRAQNECDS